MLNPSAAQHRSSPKYQVKGFAERCCYGRREFLTQIFKQFMCRRAAERGAGLKKADCFRRVPEHPFDISHMGDGNIRHPQQEQEQGI